MENLTNANPCVYVANEIDEKTDYYDKFESGLKLKPEFVSKFMAITGVEERSEGGLRLYLIGGVGKPCIFEFERVDRKERELVSRGEIVRMQFLDDMGVWDITNNLRPEDYQKLVGRNLEAFVKKGKKGEEYVAGVSPIFRSTDKDELSKKLCEDYFIREINEADASYRLLAKKKTKLDLQTLLDTKERVEEGLKKAPLKFRGYCDLGGSLDFPLYHQYLEETRDLLQLINNLIKMQKSFEAVQGIGGFGNGLDKFN